MTKMNGAQFKAFWNSEWIPGRPNVALDDWVYMIDDNVINSDENGDFAENTIADTATVKILQGAVYDQDDTNWPGIGLALLARRWLRAQTHVQLVVEVEKERVASIKALLASNKVKVLG